MAEWIFGHLQIFQLYFIHLKKMIEKWMKDGHDEIILTPEKNTTWI